MSDKNFLFWFNGFIAAIDTMNVDQLPFTQEIKIPLSMWLTLKEELKQELESVSKRKRTKTLLLDSRDKGGYLSYDRVL